MDGCIPLALQIVIDDVGWWSGRDDSAAGGPYRNNLPRNHTVADYRAIVELGRRLGMRPQAAFILCEWDRGNLLRELPTGTWQGRLWDNSRWVGPWLDEAAQVIREGRRHLELTLHGVGHEYWHEPDVLSRGRNGMTARAACGRATRSRRTCGSMPDCSNRTSWALSPILSCRLLFSTILAWDRRELLRFSCITASNTCRRPSHPCIGQKSPRRACLAWKKGFWLWIAAAISSRIIK